MRTVYSNSTHPKLVKWSSIEARIWKVNPAVEVKTEDFL